MILALSRAEFVCNFGDQQRTQMLLFDSNYCKECYLFLLIWSKQHYHMYIQVTFWETVNIYLSHWVGSFFIAKFSIISRQPILHPSVYKNNKLFNYHGKEQIGPIVPYEGRFRDLYNYVWNQSCNLRRNNADSFCTIYTELTFQNKRYNHWQNYYFLNILKTLVYIHRKSFDNSQLKKGILSWQK